MLGECKPLQQPVDPFKSVLLSLISFCSLARGQLLRLASVSETEMAGKGHAANPFLFLLTTSKKRKPTRYVRIALVWSRIQFGSLPACHE